MDTQDNLVTDTVETEWGQHLLRYLDAKVGVGEQNRDTLFETVNSIHWAIRQVLRFYLDEDIIIHILRRLDYMEGYLSWQMPVPSLTKTSLHQEATTLRTQLLDRLIQMSTEGKLRQPQSFVRFDVDGKFLPIAQVSVVKPGFVSAEAVALLYDMMEQGIVSRDMFISRLASEHPRCLLPINNEVMIACGDAPLSFCLGPGDIANFGLLPYSVAWWIDVNFPPNQLGDYPFMVQRIPSFVRKLLRKGKARLFLSAAGEMSRFGKDWYEQIAGLAQAIGCPADMIIYLPQNSGFVRDYKEFISKGDAALGTPKVIPLNSHLLLSSLRQPARIGENPSKKFLCFNNRPHIHRTALFLSMVRDDMLPDCYVSFNQSIRNQPNHVTKVTAADLAPWIGISNAEVENLIDQIDPKLPFRLDLNDETAGPSALGAYIWRFDARLHEDAAYYIVTESEMEGGSTRRFTEKTVKGLAAMNPFIVFGNAGTLATLREWGFKTFAPVIDEGYDEIEDPVARFQAAYTQLKRLHALPMERLLDERRALYPVLEHNHRQLFNTGSALLGALQKGLEG